ncbi:MAG: hypothetical protein WA003_15625 [Desulfuromonadaceae bacterium]
MAFKEIPPKQWVKAKEYFEAGLSLAKIEEKTGISRGQLSKRSNSEGWQKETRKKQLVATAVSVAVEKETLDPVALAVHDELVDERTKHILFFNKAALQNVAEAMAAPCEDQTDYKYRAETINKGRETVLGKDPTTNVQINNNPDGDGVIVFQGVQG